MEITHGSSDGGGGTPGGNDTEVQFNDLGSFGGDPGLTYDKTTNILSADSITSSRLRGVPVTGLTLISSETDPAGDSISVIGRVLIDTESVGRYAELNSSPLTGNQVFSFPDQTGTFALTTDIPTPLSLQTDGVANGSQTLLNLVAGTNITLTDDMVGSVTIDAAGGASLSPLQVFSFVSIRM